MKEKIRNNEFTYYPIIGLEAVKQGETMWMFVEQTNYVVQCSLNDMIVSKSYRIDENITVDAFFRLHIYKEKLLLIPCNARNMWIVDTCSGEATIADLMLSEKEKEATNKFRFSCIHNGKVFLFGDRLHYIFVFDLALGKCHRISNHLFLNTIEDRLFFSSGAQKNNILYIPLWKTNSLVMIDLENENLSVKEYHELQRDGFTSAVFVDEMLWLLGLNDNAVVINTAQDSAKTYKMNNIHEGDYHSYLKLLKKNDELVLIPAHHSKIFIKRIGDEFSVPIILDDESCEKEGGEKTRYGFIVSCDNYIYIQNRITGTVYLVDVHNMRVHKKMFLCNRDFLKQCFLGQSILEEKKAFALDKYLNAI